MSVDAGIQIKTVEYVSSLKVLEKLFHFGWRVNDYGKKTFLPIGDDDFDWSSEDITDQELFSILEVKTASSELIGVVLTWSDTNIGGEVLLDKDANITFSLSINRKLNIHNQTDVSWYLDKIIPALSDEGLRIEKYSYLEKL